MNQVENLKLLQMYERAMDELVLFFEREWKYNKPRVVLLPNRATIDAVRGEITEKWLVAWMQHNIVYLLLDKNYELESNHKYSDKKYYALLKHELAHCFSNTYSNYSKYPIWLLEGISIFLSGQLERKEKPEEYSNFLRYYDCFDKDVYGESGFVIEFLVKKYGKKKLLQLLKESRKSNSKKEFEILFKSLYGFELNYCFFEIL